MEVSRGFTEAGQFSAKSDDFALQCPLESGPAYPIPSVKPRLTSIRTRKGLQMPRPVCALPMPEGTCSGAALGFKCGWGMGESEERRSVWEIVWS